MANQSNSPYRHEARSFRPQSDAESYPGSTRLITPRQLQCLAWVQEGKSATDIGGILGLSGRTVEGHLTKLCSHLGVKTRIQAVVRARELGLIGQSQP